MVPKRLLSASLALGLASSGCGGDDGPLEAPGSDGGTSAGPGATPGRGGTNAGAAGSVGIRGGSGGAPSGSGTAGSNGGSAGGGLSTPDSGRPLGAGASTGCDREPMFQSGIQELEVGGLARTFIVDLPADYSSGNAYPLVFGFHGRDFSAEDFRSPSYGNLLSAAGGEAIVVHPDATADAGAWELESDLDVEFFDAMLGALTQGLCVDESRVFATGHSSGGYFTNVLGCRRGDVLRAIAPIAGGGPFGAAGGEPSCERPVSAWIAHSEDDETVSFSNGEGSLDYWLGADDCDAEAEPVDPDPCVAYQGCADGLAVHWCSYAGGHDWPAFAAGAIWEFFESQ